MRKGDYDFGGLSDLLRNGDTKKGTDNREEDLRLFQ